MKKKIAAAAVGVLALGVASGTAFTGSVTGVDNKMTGYGSALVSGATVESVNFIYNPDGSQLTAIKMDFTEDVSGKKVTVTATGGVAPEIKSVVVPLDNAGAPVTINLDNAVSAQDLDGYAIAVGDNTP